MAFDQDARENIGSFIEKYMEFCEMAYQASSDEMTGHECMELFKLWREQYDVRAALLRKVAEIGLPPMAEEFVTTKEDHDDVEREDEGESPQG